MKKLLLLLLLSAGLLPASAYTDLDTGMRVFLTRDPSGFVDGPNLYTYVKQNPWTHFDPEGLNEDMGDGIQVHRDADGHVRVLRTGPSEELGTSLLGAVAEVQVNKGDSKSMQMLNANLNSLTSDRWTQSVVLDWAITGESMTLDQRKQMAGAFALGMSEMASKGGGLAAPEFATTVNAQNKQAAEETTAPTTSAKTTQTESSTTATVTVDASKYPESAQHIQEAQAAGQPSVLTINRGGATTNRKAAMQGQPTVPGKDRDEYPPAMFSEGGQGASVKPIAPSDNRGAGSTIMHQTKNMPNGTQVQVKVKDDNK